MTNLPNHSAVHVKRIPDEVFEEAERDIAEADAKAGIADAQASIADARAGIADASVVDAKPKMDRLDVFAHRVLPFVVVTAAAVWISGSMIMWTGQTLQTALIAGIASLAVGFAGALTDMALHLHRPA